MIEDVSSSIDIAPGHRTPSERIGGRGPRGPAIVVDRIDSRIGGGIAYARIILTAFTGPPSIILSACYTGSLEIDFFTESLADIRDVEIPVCSIKTVSPRIAQAVRPDFWERPPCPTKGLLGGTT